MNNMVQSKQ